MGLGAAATAAIASILPETLAFAAPEITGALIGAGGGALLGEVTGGSPLKGAEAGAITGGFIPAGGALGGALGGTEGAVAGDILGGAAGGALGGAATGGSPLTGALEGGLAGGVSAYLPGGAGNAGGTGGASIAPGAVGGAAPAASAGGAASAPGDIFTNPALSSMGDVYGGGPGAAALGTGAVAGGGTGPLGIGTSGLPTANITPAVTDTLTQAQAPASSLLSGPVSISGGPGNPGTNIVNNTTGIGAGAGGGTPAPTFGQSLSSFVANPSLAGAGQVATSISPAALIGGGGLAYEALNKPASLGSSTGLSAEAQAQANQLATTSQSLLSAEQTGQLPAGAAAGVQQGLESAQAAIRSQFASLGLSGSPMEAEALAAASQTAAANSFNIAAQMAQQGLSIAGLPAQIYQNILQQTLTEDQQFSQAITNFATAAAGGGPRIQIGGAA